MRIFLFVSSILSLLLASHRLSLAEGTGQYKSGLFFLLIGIQLLIAAALISEHRESQATKIQAQKGEDERKAVDVGVENGSVGQGKNS